jgi:protein-L-isoaspartate(D-aspartate) O-methyltransferase
MTTARGWLRWAVVGCLALGWLTVGWLHAGQAWGQARDAMTVAREKMVDEEIVGAGIKNERVIRAMRETPRHEFVPVTQREHAYLDMALPIGEGQTISPPFVVASMTEALDPQPGDKVLEIGTGSGYQAAVLSRLVREVCTIEIVGTLGRRAMQTLKQLKCSNVKVKIGDGYQGWPEEAPFDKIIVTCSPEQVPQPLIEQLKEEGRMVIPVGERYEQTIYLMKKKDGEMETESLQPTLFVPMTGQAEEQRKVLPDPANPSVNNGSFEEVSGESGAPKGWHYQRQLELVSDGTAPEGKNYVTIRNSEPGRGAQALQGFAVDGREVKRLELSFMVRGEDLRPGQTIEQQAAVTVVLYDQNRAMLGYRTMGPWRGTFGWQRELDRFEVPAGAREAIIRIALLGALGEISFDAIELRAVK